jgi:twinkle protein
MALDMAMLGEPVLICSFEMAPVATLVRMIKQSASTGAVTRRWAEAFLSWAQSKVWVYNKRGQASSEKLLRLAAFAAERHGIKHVFIDSLMKCVAGEDDYNGQKDFVDQCCVLAMAAGVHVHLVHHIRKPSDETQMFSKFDVKGSGAIVDQVDCAIGVWRNKRKEEKRRQGKLAEDEESLPDAVLIVDKNRHIECEGKFGLYYVPGAQSYTDFRGRPVRYDLGEHWEDGEVRV